jgi:hypothetical protein
MPIASAAPSAQTCDEIITDAMADAGLIGQGDSPNSEDFATNMRRLNKLVNYLQTKGLKLWVQQDYGLTAPLLQTGVGLYTFGPAGSVVMTKPRRVIEAYYADSNQNRRPLIVLSRNEWDTLSTISTKGTVTGYFVDKQQLSLNINLWLVPDSTAATGTVHFIFDRQIGNFSQITDTMAFPPEWALTLEWGLAHQLSTGQPQSVIDRCKENAFFYQAELEDWDVEDPSTSFQPDQRTQFTGRRFS